MLSLSLLLLLHLISFSKTQVIPAFQSPIESQNLIGLVGYHILQQTLDQITLYTEVEGSIYLQKDENSAAATSYPMRIQVIPNGLTTTENLNSISAEPFCEGNVIILSSSGKEFTSDIQAKACVSINKKKSGLGFNIREFNVSGVTDSKFRELLETISTFDSGQVDKDSPKICFREVSSTEASCISLEEIGSYISPFTVLSKRSYIDHDNDGDIEQTESGLADQEKGWARITEILSDLVGDSLNQKLTEKLSSLSAHELKRVYDWRKNVDEEFDDSLQYSFQRIDRAELTKRDDISNSGLDSTENDNKVSIESAEAIYKINPELTQETNIDCSPVTWFNIFRHSVFGTLLCQ